LKFNSPLETVESIDATSKEMIYRAIEDLVARKEFIIDLKDENDKIVNSFLSEDIFPATLQASSDSANSIPLGSSNYFPLYIKRLKLKYLFSRIKASFFKQFLIASFDADFNLNETEKNLTISIRKRNGISIDECARLCVREPAFKCESLTYENSLTECKWSSVTVSLLESLSDSPLVIDSEGYTFFFSNNCIIFIYNFDLHIYFKHIRRSIL